ncbi:MAG TPA: ABC transporter [Veillonella dispar]|uniref:ABC transporter permease n=2 Tax=Veillonella sp. TaxID=1926307 RepID=UPI000EEBFEBF|nr:ABC transporter permease [Veillonella sp.]MBS6294164.1 ABC transporter permease [Veillonella sp.]HCK95215.1 ABC transporter [Veillonella dispar]
MYQDIVKYRNLVVELVMRDIKKKYRRSILGYLWSMLNPLLTMLITAMVFSNLFRFQIDNFALYLLTGQLIFTFYSEATSFAMGSILENGSLIKKVYVPKYLFPISRVSSSAVNLLFSLPAMLAIMLYTDHEITITLVACIVPLILLYFFCIGIGLFISALAVYFRDIFHLYGVLITVLNYATPIFYPVNIIPEEYKFVVEYNPLYYFLSAFREVAYNNTLPSIELLSICTLFSVGALVVGAYYFNKKQNTFVMYL